MAEIPYPPMVDPEPTRDDDHLLETMRKQNACALDRCEHLRHELERQQRVVAATQAAIDQLDPPDTAVPTMASSVPLDRTAYRNGPR